jgi:hypothetical protein
MPDFNVTGELHRMEMRTPIPGAKLHPRPRYLDRGPVGDLMKRVLAKRDGDRPIYSITVPREAGFGKDELSFRDIEALAQHPQFPKGDL